MKKYFSSRTEFFSGEGDVYSEFINGVATRQISICDKGSFASSCIKDWHEDVGFLLFDGKLEELDLTNSNEMSSHFFEEEWRNAVSKEDLDVFISLEKGDASIPKSSSMMIVHIVNDLGRWGRGFVVSLSNRYPVVRRRYLDWAGTNAFLLGDIQLVEVDGENRVFVANMLAQHGIRKFKTDTTQYVSYDSLRSCLEKVADEALVRRLSVQMPMIGAGLGGGSWGEIEKIIIDTLCFKKVRCTVFSM